MKRDLLISSMIFGLTAGLVVYALQSFAISIRDLQTIMWEHEQRLTRIEKRLSYEREE